MSGIEVAGLVLGALPLIIHAVEQYAKGVSTINGTIKYETTFLDIYTTLLGAHTRLRHACELVLQGVDVEDAKFCRLVEEQEGWDEEWFKLELRKRLKADFHSFESTLAQIQKNTKKFAKELKLEGPTLSPRFIVNGNVDEALRTKFFRKSNLTWERIRLGHKADKHRAQASKILQNVDTLNELVKTSLYLQDERQVRSHSSSSGYWLSIRSHTCRLHDVLQAVWPHTCPIHSHTVTLELQTPSHDDADQNHVQFQASFSLTNEETQPGWSRKDVKVLTTQKSSDVEPHDSVSTSGPTQKKVRLLHDPANQKNCSSKTVINDLCGILATGPWKSECLGVLAHQEWNFHIHEVRVPTKLSKLISLRTMLKIRTLTPRERCLYALCLASAVLLLYETPWLRETWSLDDVYVKDGGGQHLYISRTFDHSSSNAHSTYLATKEYSPARNDTVFALGVALLELVHGQEITHFQTDQDRDGNSSAPAMTKFRIADRLTKEAQGIQTQRLAFALGRCICPVSDTYDFKLSSDRYRKKFYQDVVSSLQEEYEFLFDKAAPY